MTTNIQSDSRDRIALMVSNICKKGGVERVAVNLGSALNQYYDCSIITRWKSGKYPYNIDEKIKIFNLYTENKKIQHISVVALIKICQYLRNNKIKILIVIGRNNGILPFFVKIFTGIKLIYCEHNAYYYYKYEKENVVYKTFRRMIQYFLKYIPNYVVTLTERELIHYKNTNVKSCAISNFVDEKLFRDDVTYNQNAKAIITVGRIDYQKGYEYLIQVAKRVLVKHPDWKWDIYGDGEQPYKSEILSLVEKNGLKGKLNFKGTSDNIYKLYCNYSLYIMTSRYEGLPMVLLEAKANKLPIVSFDIDSGPSDIIRNNLDGYLIEPFDVEEMANKVNFLIESPEKRKIFSANSDVNLEKFSKKNIMNKWLNLINKAKIDL